MNRPNTKTRRRFIEQWFEAKGPFCHYCARVVFKGWGRLSGDCPPNQATVEHLTPIAAGGTNERANLVVSCFACNNRKSVEDQGLYERFVATGLERKAG